MLTVQASTRLSKGIWLLGKAIAVTVLIILSSAARAQPIPADAATICVVPDLSSFFASGTISANGVVTPPDSVNFNELKTFPNGSFERDPNGNLIHMNCPFYQWGWRMFLWLTSPEPLPFFDPDARTQDSAAFYDVLPRGSDNQRALVSHTLEVLALGPRRFNLRVAKPGATGLPSILKGGKLLPVAPLQTGPTGKPLIFNKQGDLVEVARATLDSNKKPEFFDKAGKAIEARGLAFGPRFETGVGFEKIACLPCVQAMQFSGIQPVLVPIYIDQDLNVVNIEQNQAGDSGVLVAQTGSLVYYISMINDVMAYFRTANARPPTQT